ncbi:hypothetical protein TWF718_003612 [Orbilia javanica]|uniref:Uncharacterized protein n=1 Tax=Orbilia javanica TaxID=47235 RepID=A0AAN8N3I9_9PEZI
MIFDGPYPSYSGSMGRVIHDALSPPSHGDIDELLSVSPSIHKTSFKLSRYIGTWLRSRPILKRLRSFGNQPENRSIAFDSSISIPLIAVNKIIKGLPEGDSSNSNLVQSTQNVENCFKPSEGGDPETETTCMSPCTGSSINSRECMDAQGAQMPPVIFPGEVRGLEAKAMGMYPRVGRHVERELRFKKRYLEIRDGVWDLAVGTFIPNAWPVDPGMKTTLSKPKVLRKWKG